MLFLSISDLPPRFLSRFSLILVPLPFPGQLLNSFKIASPQFRKLQWLENISRNSKMEYWNFFKFFFRDSFFLTFLTFVIFDRNILPMSISKRSSLTAKESFSISLILSQIKPKSYLHFHFSFDCNHLLTDDNISSFISCLVFGYSSYVNDFKFNLMKNVRL